MNFLYRRISAPPQFNFSGRFPKYDFVEGLKDILSTQEVEADVQSIRERDFGDFPPTTYLDRYLHNLGWYEASICHDKHSFLCA
jgi:hypothetical protein